MKLITGAILMLASSILYFREPRQRPVEHIRPHGQGKTRGGRLRGVALRAYPETQWRKLPACGTVKNGKLEAYPTYLYFLAERMTSVSG